MRLEIGIDERGVADIRVGGRIDADDGPVLAFAVEAVPVSATIVLDLRRVKAVERRAARLLAEALCRIAASSHAVLVVMAPEADQLVSLRSALGDAVPIRVDRTIVGGRDDTAPSDPDLATMPQRAGRPQVRPRRAVESAA